MKVFMIFGTVLIFILVLLYTRDTYNADPIFIGKTTIITGKVTGNKLVPKFKSLAHNIKYNYMYEGKEYEGNYYTFSSRGITKVQEGDKLKIEISDWFPSQDKVIGYSIRAR